MLAGDRTVRIGWDDEATAAAVRAATEAWPETAASRHLPVAFGVRSVAVGLLRRRMWLVHFGTPVRHRANDLAGAARFVDGLLRSIAAGGPADDEVTTSAPPRTRRTGRPCSCRSRTTSISMSAR